MPERTVHDLKTWPEPFQAVWERRKCAEFRADDRGFRDGDALILREFDPDSGRYIGRSVGVTITHVCRGGAFGIPVGYAMLSFRMDWSGDWSGVGHDA